jgi:hypothetical protein
LRSISQSRAKAEWGANKPRIKAVKRIRCLFMVVSSVAEALVWKSDAST